MMGGPVLRPLIRRLHVKIVKTIVGVIMLLAGILWTLQGANIVGGSVMSGQSQWLYIGIVVGLAGLALLYWTHLRRRA
jgi:hypothetical protein